MRPIRSQAAFSLIEVALALAIVAGAVVVILALLTQLGKQAAHSAETHTALRLPDAVAVELRTLAAQRGFDVLAGAVPVMSAATDEGLLLVATRDGLQVRLLVNGESPPREQYFLIEIRRFPAAPLAYQASTAVLPLNVRVSWPYRILTPAGLAEAIPFTERQSLNFNLALAR